MTAKRAGSLDQGIKVIAMNSQIGRRRILLGAVHATGPICVVDGG